MTQLIQWVTSAPAWVVYAIVAALAFGESAALVGLVLPGETIVLLGGVLTATGRADLPVMLGVAAVAAVAGDSVGYEMGRLGGGALRRSRVGRFVGEGRWRRAEVFMARRGGWAVFGGRWIALMRALVPAVAGMTRMPYRRFVLANAAGGVLWATAVVVAGHLAGASWRRMQGYLGGASAVLLAIVVNVVVAVLLARWAVRHRWTVLRAWRRLLDGAIVATLRRKHARSFTFAAARLRPGTVAGLGLTVGLAVVGVLTALFAGLFDTVLEGDGIASLDRPVTAWLAAHRNTAMNLVMRAVTDVGSAAGLAAIAVAVAGAVAWRTRSWLPVSVMTATAAGSVTITVVGKYLVGRGRPALEFAQTPATGYSFPSGHTTNSVAILGVGAWLLCRTTRSWRARVWITTGTVIGTSLVSFSRIYLGVHWLTDILASWLLAGTWLAVVITTMGVLAARRHDDTNADASGVGGRANPTRRPVHGAASGRGLARPRPEHRTIQRKNQDRTVAKVAFLG